MVSFDDAISLSLLLVYIIPIGLMFYDIKHYVMLLAVLFVASTTEFMKPFIPSPRPKGAKDCNLFCEGGAVGGQPGFPSGHMGSLAVFVGLLYDAFPSPAVFLGSLLWLVLMAYSRYAKHCHTFTQIVAGTCYGLAVALVIRITGINA
jgi:membrane-associated phospholipid phosphatase